MENKYFYFKPFNKEQFEYIASISSKYDNPSFNNVDYCRSLVFIFTPNNRLCIGLLNDVRNDKYCVDIRLFLKNKYDYINKSNELIELLLDYISKNNWQDITKINDICEKFKNKDSDRHCSECKFFWCADPKLTEYAQMYCTSKQRQIYTSQKPCKQYTPNSR